jgi:hypothetical protein
MKLVLKTFVVSLAAADIPKLVELAKYLLHNFGSKQDVSSIAIANDAANGKRMVKI